MKIWPNHDANEQLIQEKLIEDLRARAAKGDLNELEMSEFVRELLVKSLEAIKNFGEIIEVIENKSVCLYRPPEFFVELLPLTYNLRIMLPLDYQEISKPSELVVTDASNWKFVKYRNHSECNTLIDIGNEEDIESVIPIIRQSYELA